MKRELLVLCPGKPDWGLLSKAAELALADHRKVHFLTDSQENAEQSFAYGADMADWFFDKENLSDDYLLASWLRAQIEKKWKPEIILAPATIRMRAVMPILAGMLDAGLTADCTDLTLQEDGRLLQIRPAFGNNLMAQIQTISDIQMATIRPGIFLEKKYDRPTGTVRKYEITGCASVTQLEFSKFEETSPLNQAEIIFAGGMGVGSKEGFAFLGKVAAKVGASLGASRMAVDAGFAPYSCQIGQTGVTVHPRIYVAVGISGAVQHLAGMSGSEKIIAINSDPKAPIFDYADYGIVGDWQEIMSLFLEKL